MNKSILIIVLTFCFVACTQGHKTYYDANWKETTQENAAYYRPQPIKENDLWHIEDYYITGEKQFNGQAKDSLATMLDGDVTWYFKSGKVENKLRYINGKVAGSFASFEGAIGNPETGWDEKDLYYYDQTRVTNAKSATQDIYEYYYTDTYIVASQNLHNVGDDKISFRLFFNKKGDTIGRLDKNKASEKWEGKEVFFYETEQRGKNGMNSVKQINSYKEGKRTETEYYDTNEKQIAKGSLKNEEPFTGTFFKETCSFHKIQHYKNGNLLKELTYNKSDEKIGEVNFKNKVPNTGVFFNCMSLQTYKNGKLHGPLVIYQNHKAEVEDSRFNYKNGKKHGEYFIYDGTLLEKGTYKNDMQKGEVWYYHNGIFYEGDNAELYYYLKATVQSVNSKPFISEISQYDLDTNELQRTFKLEANTTDTFTYINNGYHAIYLNDLNSDGHTDLQITYSHNMQDITSQTYYLYNAESGEYQHIPDLDNLNEIEINTSEKTIKGTIRERFKHDKNHLTFGFEKNKLIKKLEIEEIYHQEKNITSMTQIFPVPVDDFPLLNPNLPPISIIQQEKEQLVMGTDQTIALKKVPFSIRLPGLLFKESSKEFRTKVMASYDRTVFNVAEINQKVEDTPFYGMYATIAYDRNTPELYLSLEGYNVLFYDSSEDDTLSYVKNINEDVMLLDFAVSFIHNDGVSIPISEVNKPIYMVVFIDKNENYKVDANEINYLILDLNN